jgi:hypothetical protein
LVGIQGWDGQFPSPRRSSFSDRCGRVIQSKRVNAEAELAHQKNKNRFALGVGIESQQVERLPDPANPAKD